MEMKRALLLNPPGDQKYLRDYFCSTVSKTGYYWHPIDLLIQSGFLSKKFKVDVLDAIAEGISYQGAIKKIELLKPDIIVLLTSVLSVDNDMLFLKQIEQMLPNRKFFLVGEPLLEDPEGLMKRYGFVNGGMFSFVYDDITAYVEERYHDIKAMIFKQDNQIKIRSTTLTKEPLKFPIPRHELFPLKSYWMPFIMHHPFASVLTTYGCPYTCSYCNSGADTMGFIKRDVRDVIEELKYIKRLGIQHVFIKDMTFGVPRQHALSLCESMIREELKLTWHCYSRADVVDAEMLKYMKMAGCNLIQFGVETSNESTLQKYNKNIPLYKTIQAFELAHKYGILTGAHFIFGLPGDGFDDMVKTLQLAKSLKPVYVSLNIATPRYGTPLRNEFMIDKNRSNMTDKDIERFVKRANIDFYIRPSYLVYLLKQIKTITQFRSIIKEGAGMLRYLVNQKYNNLG